MKAKFWHYYLLASFIEKNKIIRTLIGTKSIYLVNIIAISLLELKLYFVNVQSLPKYQRIEEYLNKITGNLNLFDVQFYHVMSAASWLL